MQYHMLNSANLPLLVAFETEARATEGDIFTEDFDPAQFKADTQKALENPMFSNTCCLLYINDENKVLGRLDFSWAASFAFGGDLQVYVDWVYVLKAHRHQGIAQKLFAKMEEYIASHGGTSYLLLMADNPEAQRFYHHLPGTDISTSQVLKKYF